MPKPAKKSTQTSVTKPAANFQYLVLLGFLSLLNISFFFGFGGNNSHLPCSADTIIDVVSIYIANNGETTLPALMPSHCVGDIETPEKHLRESVSDLLHKCRAISDEERDSKKRTKPFVTLVTTFANHVHTDDEKVPVHQNTIVNWSKLRPYVNLVLFANDSYLSEIAESYGWDVLKPEDEISGKRPPILKSMMLTAMARHDTPWYGYINADILITSDLKSNLESISKRYNTSSERVMLTGRRTNVSNFTTIDPNSDASIWHHAKKFGTLYNEDAEDFFITTKNFPWNDIVPLVVGRPAYDNWLVGEARCSLNTMVIDVTQTFLALHQTTAKGGNNEGHFHHDTDYNLQVLKNHKIVPHFLTGLTDCIIFSTFKNFCDSVDVLERTKFGPGCKCAGKS